MSEFERSVRDPESWLKQAQQFLIAGKELSSLIIHQGPRTESSLQRQSGALKGTLLLLAVSAENSFKAVKVFKSGISIKNGKINASSFSGGRSGHDLSLLAKDVGYEIPPGHTDFLERLSKIARWAGKYQHPFTEAEFLAARAPNVRQITLPTDIAVVEDIYNYAQGQILKSA